MNRPCYNNLLQIMQHVNLRNLNRVTFTEWKHLASRVNVCFKVIKQYDFHYLMKLVPYPESKPESFWNIATVWYMVLSNFFDIIF